jgi:hypothetical protein
MLPSKLNIQILPDVPVLEFMIKYAEEHYGSDDLQLGCYRNIAKIKCISQKLQVPFEFCTTFRSPLTP